MVIAATEGQHGFVVDDREMRRDGPSYSVDTLASLRAENPDRSLCLIVGMDAFLSLPKWYQWREILQLAHVVVAHRPGWRAPGMGPLGELLVDRGTGRVELRGSNLLDLPRWPALTIGVLTFVAEINHGKARSPLLSEEGWTRPKANVAEGLHSQERPGRQSISDHPVCAFKGSFAIFFDAQPPLLS